MQIKKTCKQFLLKPTIYLFLIYVCVFPASLTAQETPDTIDWEALIKENPNEAGDESLQDGEVIEDDGSADVYLVEEPPLPTIENSTKQTPLSSDEETSAATGTVDIDAEENSDSFTNNMCPNDSDRNVLLLTAIALFELVCILVLLILYRKEVYKHKNSTIESNQKQYEV